MGYTACRTKFVSASTSIVHLDPDCHAAGVSVLTSACANLPLLLLQTTEQYPSWPLNISTSQRDSTSPKWKELKRLCLSMIVQRFTRQIPQPLKLPLQVAMAPHVSDLFPISPLPQLFVPDISVERSGFSSFFNLSNKQLEYLRLHILLAKSFADSMQAFSAESCTV